MRIFSFCPLLQNELEVKSALLDTQTEWAQETGSRCGPWQPIGNRHPSERAWKSSVQWEALHAVKIEY